MNFFIFVLFVTLALPVTAQINQGGGGGDSVEITPDNVLQKAETNFMTAMKIQWPKCSKEPLPENIYKIYEVVSTDPKKILNETLKTPQCLADTNPLAACLATDYVKTKLKAVVESEYFMLYMISKYKLQIEEFGKIATFYKAVLKEE